MSHNRALPLATPSGGARTVGFDEQGSSKAKALAKYPLGLREIGTEDCRRVEAPPSVEVGGATEVALIVELPDAQAEEAGVI